MAGQVPADGSVAKRQRRRRHGWRRLIPTWRMVLATVLVVLLVIIGGFVTLYLTVSIPKANALAVKQSNIWLYSDGSEIGRTGDVNRQNIPLSEVPITTQHAVLAAENRTFYQDSGVDPKGIARAAWNMLHGGSTQSGSTITQQYVKNYYLNQQQTLSRKLKEIVISIKVDQKETKDDILDGYLNTSYFGRNAYGIEAAAKSYYGIDASKLTVGEGAYLAALLNAPGLYDVRNTTPALRKEAIARWNYVLDGMVKSHWLSQKQRATIKFPEPIKQRPDQGYAGQAGYLITAAKKYLIDQHVLSERQLDQGGWKITTSFSKSRQADLVKSVRGQLAKLPKTKGVNTGAASIDPKNGRVLALYGGPDYLKNANDYATQTAYPVGSTFKPFVLAAALQNHAKTQSGITITPNTVYDGTSGREVVGAPTKYAPPNEDHQNYGPISVQRAMDFSVNSVFAQMAVDVGLGKVRDAAIEAGIPSTTPAMSAKNPAIALGVAQASPVNMASGYATLANHGVYVQPTMVVALSHDGRAVKLPAQDTHRAFSRAAADTVTSVLTGVINSPGGTGYVAAELNRPAAGKTGTTDNNHSAWFTGYTPDLVTSVGMFGEKTVTRHGKSVAEQADLGSLSGYGDRINGGAVPAQIWTDYMKAALSGTPRHSFQLDTSLPSRSSGTPSRTTPVAPPPSSSPPTASTPSGQPSTPATSGGQPPSRTTPVAPPSSSSPATGGTSPSSGPTGGEPSTGGGAPSSPPAGTGGVEQPVGGTTAGLGG